MLLGNRSLMARGTFSVQLHCKLVVERSQARIAKDLHQHYRTCVEEKGEREKETERRHMTEPLVKANSAAGLFRPPSAPEQAHGHNDQTTLRRLVSDLTPHLPQRTGETSIFIDCAGRRELHQGIPSQATR